MDTKTTPTKATRRSFSKFIRHPEQYPMQLNQRDLEILKLVYDYRFIPSDHVTNLIQGHERKLLERLQKLFHHGYLDRVADRRIRTHAGSDRMVYAITNKAALLLVDECGIDLPTGNWTSKNRWITDRQVKHTLMIARFRTIITLAANSEQELALRLWKESRGSGRNINPDLADTVMIDLEKGRQEQHRVIPDAFLALDNSGFKNYLYLEADRSTMTNERFLKKLQAYWAWWKQGRSKAKHQVEHFRVLTITPSHQRRDNLRQIATQASPGKGGSGMFWFACEKDFAIEDPASILGPIWTTAKDQEKHCLLESTK